MFEYLDFKEVPGNHLDQNIKMLALSTCGFCKRAKAFLREQEVGFSFVDVDTLDKEVKKQIRKDFTDAFGKSITYPALIIGEEDFLVGFIKASWISTLGLETD